MPKQTCENCGVELTKDTTYELDGQILCKDCRDQYYTCGECTCLVYEETLCEYHGNIVCESCYNAHFSICTCCGDSYDRDYEEGAWGDMCESCANEHFVCDGCDRTLHMEEYDEDDLCQDCCREQRVTNLHQYHDGASCGIRFQPTREYDALYFGVELETDRYDDRQEASEQLYKISNDEYLFWQEEDCSLDNGIEIITQPCSLDFLRSEFPWAKIREIVRANGGFSENTEQAALHIHFSRSFFGIEGGSPSEPELRLIYLFEKFWGELVTLARTSDYLLRRSALRYQMPLGLFLGQLTSVEHERIAYAGRYMAVNLDGGNDTIEIRLFRGTLNRNTILASIELVDFLVRLAKDASKRELQRMSWAELLKKIYDSDYQYLPEYAKKRLAKEHDELPTELSMLPRVEAHWNVCRQTVEIR